MNIDLKNLVKGYYSYNIHERNRISLLLFILHYHKMINNESLNANLKNLKDVNKKDFLFKRTYHFKHTDTWYNDQKYEEILMEIIDNYILNYVLPFEELIKYLQLSLNANRNFAINNFLIEFIGPVTKSFSYDNKIIADVFNIEGFREPEKDTSGYCCEDCDGPIEDYRRYYNNYELKEKIIEYNKMIINSVSGYYKKKNSRLDFDEISKEMYNNSNFYLYDKFW